MFHRAGRVFALSLRNAANQHTATASTKVRAAGPLNGEHYSNSTTKLASAEAKPAKMSLEDLLQVHRPGYSLAQQFYTDPEIFEADLSRVWGRQWLFCGHSCELVHPGDRFVYELGNVSVVVVRDEKGRVAAFHNTCRHRGSRLCKGAQRLDNGAAAPGHKRLTCPYHQWAYGLDGKLLSAPHFPELDRSKFGLQPVHCEEVDGLVFINLSPLARDQLPDFTAFRTHLSPQLRFQGLAAAKIAFVEEYTISANWKLVYENNRECLHCLKGHPEYIKANYDTAYSYDSQTHVRTLAPNLPVHRREEVLGALKTSEEHWTELGLQQGDTTQTSFPGEGWYKCARAPLKRGFVTESMDGSPVCRLPLATPPNAPADWKTNPKHWDTGSLRVHTFPSFWIHCSSDHAVSTRLVPVSPLQTKARISWLVNKEAVEGLDYNREKMAAFWKITGEQDWELCNENQVGVCSPAYQPGPYSLTKEWGVHYFITWYLSQISARILSTH